MQVYNGTRPSIYEQTQEFTINHAPAKFTPLTTAPPTGKGPLHFFHSKRNVLLSLAAVIATVSAVIMCSQFSARTLPNSLPPKEPDASNPPLKPPFPVINPHNSSLPDIGSDQKCVMSQEGYEALLTSIKANKSIHPLDVTDFQKGKLLYNQWSTVSSWYDTGRGENDYNKDPSVFTLLEQAASLKYPPAMFELGASYLPKVKDDGLTFSSVRNIKGWLDRARSLDPSVRIYYIPSINHESAHFPLNKDINKAEELLLAAAHAGNELASFVLSQLYRGTFGATYQMPEKVSFAKSIEFSIAVSDKKDTPYQIKRDYSIRLSDSASDNLGFVLSNGMYRLETEFGSQYFPLLQPHVDRGSPTAQCYLGYMKAKELSCLTPVQAAIHRYIPLFVGTICTNDDKMEGLRLLELAKQQGKQPAERRGSWNVDKPEVYCFQAD